MSIQYRKHDDIISYTNDEKTTEQRHPLSGSV